MKKTFVIFFVLLCFLIKNISYAWDNSGHMLIAQIAYSQLTPSVKKRVNYLLDVLNEDYPYSRGIAKAATWADIIRAHDVSAFNNWHYINIPLRTEINETSDLQRQHLPKIAPPNIVWAINQCLQVLQSSHANKLEKAIFLRFLLHLVGDIHQPLHCITRITKEQPFGDEGGNKTFIKNGSTNNLHELWDHGVGFFAAGSSDYPFKYSHIKFLAKKIMTDYPDSYFKKELYDMDPSNWAFDSFTIAKNVAYDINEDGRTSAEYIDKAQLIVEKQIALAGYRMAKLLNMSI